MERTDIVRFTVYTLDKTRYIALNPEDIQFPLDNKTIEVLCDIHISIGGDKVIPDSEVPNQAKYLFRGTFEKGYIEKMKYQSNEYEDRKKREKLIEKHRKDNKR